MNVDFTDLTLKETKVKNMKILDSCYYDGLVELRIKSNKFYICCVWGSSNEFTIVGRFISEEEAREEFKKWQEKRN